MTRLRRMLYPLRLAGARLAARGDRALLVVLGTAAGAAVLAAVLAGSLVARDQSLARATGGIPSPQRVVKASWFGIPVLADEQEAVLDRGVRQVLAGVDSRRATEAVVIRRSTLGGRFIALAAADGLRPWIRLTSGRLPRTCTRERCEVVQIGGHGRIPHASGLPLVKVGTGTLVSSALFGDFFTPSTDVFVRKAVNYHQPPVPPLLVAEGVNGVVALPEVQHRYRTYSWILPVRAGDVHPWDADDFAARVRRATSALAGTNASSFEVSAPLEQIATAATRSEVAGRRLLLIGGEAAALLLAFAALAATAMRRDVVAARRRLTWFGARRWQLELLTGAEAAGLAFAGALLGWAIGIGIAALVSRAAGSPTDGVLANSVASGTGLLVAAGLAVAAAAIVLVAVRSRTARAGRFALSPVDVAALGALAVVLVGIARGDAGAESLTGGGGTGVFLILLPGLITFVMAVLVARLLGPLLLGLERLVRGRSVPLRLAVLSLARNPGHAAVAVAFLVVSLGLGLFAETYRSTLVRGQDDQAAFAHPSDFVLTEPTAAPERLVDVATPAAVKTLPASAVASPVLRLSGNAGVLGTGRSIDVLGVPAAELGRIDGWRSDFSDTSLQTLADRIRPTGPTRMLGPRIPDDARVLELPARGRAITLTGSVRTPAGAFVTLDVGDVTPAGGVLRASVPAAARGGTLVALTLTPPRLEDRGADAGQPYPGTLELGPPRTVDSSGSAADVPVDYRRWLGVARVVPSAETTSATLRYTLTNEVVSRFRPRQPTDGHVVPVIVSPRLAAGATAGGNLRLQIADQNLVVQVVGIARRFPSLGADFVVADEAVLGTALNAALPGGALPSELWIDAPPGATGAVRAAAASDPLDALRLESRTAFQANLAADPLAHGSLLTLSTAALVALALALAGLLLGVVSDLRDERGELFDLEAQGAEPTALRRQARLRAGLVAALGLLGGLATAAVLGTLVVDLVRVTANAAAPEPPLRLAVDWPRVALWVAVYALVAAALVALATRRAVRSSGIPVRVAEVEPA
ncbi:MAG TPA: hypothetical protein VH306_05715 [Gaiellaceae bacterium]